MWFLDFSALCGKTCFKYIFISFDNAIKLVINFHGLDKSTKKIMQ